nr:MAG TPA: hypothetical protein [Bacteriophage sp.]
MHNKVVCLSLIFCIFFVFVYFRSCSLKAFVYLIPIR